MKISQTQHGLWRMWGDPLLKPLEVVFSDEQGTTSFMAWKILHKNLYTHLKDTELAHWATSVIWFGISMSLPRAPVTSSRAKCQNPLRTRVEKKAAPQGNFHAQKWCLLLNFKVFCILTAVSWHSYQLYKCPVCFFKSKILTMASSGNVFIAVL